MARKRDSSGRFKSDDGILPDLSSLSLGELAGLRDFYGRNAEAETKAARAKGGAGSNRLDKRAAEFSRKQVNATREILSRLTKINLTRSKTARIADDSKRATITRNPRKWARNKSRYDYPGVDTPDSNEVADYRLDCGQPELAG